MGYGREVRLPAAPPDSRSTKPRVGESPALRIATYAGPYRGLRSVAGLRRPGVGRRPSSGNASSSSDAVPRSLLKSAGAPLEHRGIRLRVDAELAQHDC